MREYAKLAPTMWTGPTGRELRRRGFEALFVATYLISAPGSNMLGLYYQPVLYMAHETGLGIEGASKGLRECIACGFCAYDEASETVWVPEMAKWQIAEQLKATDKRCAGIQREYESLPDNPFLGAFFDRYEKAFHLTRRRTGSAISVPPDEAPSKPLAMGGSKPLRSQEQEQEQEQYNPPSPLAAEPAEPAMPAPQAAPEGCPGPVLKANGSGTDPPGFVRFWAEWPRSERKGGRGECAKAWQRLGLEAETEAVLAHLAAMKASREWRKDAGAFIPAPATYLRQRRWDGAMDGNGADRQWWREAGFATPEEASVDGCYAHNAEQFRDGKRIGVAH